MTLSLTTCVLTGDVGTSSTTLGNISPSFGFTVGSGTIYQFAADLVYVSGASGAVPTWNVTGPTASTFMAQDISGTVITGSNGLGVLEGTIKPTSAGSVVFQFGSSINGSRVTVRAGSSARMWQIT